MALRVGINGAGRIGRALIRLLLDDDAIELSAINDVAPIDRIAHLLRYDSVHGRLPVPVDVVRARGGQALKAGPRTIPVAERPTPDPGFWNEHGVDVVIEATGRFSHADRARGHAGGTVARVVVTAVCDDADETIVLGVHSGDPRPEAVVVSAASCTTHAAALPLWVLDRVFGVTSGQMTTVHCTTGSQHTMDAPHEDPRRARSCLLSMIPTSTSAARGLVAALGPLGARISCLAIRVPTATVSLIELVVSTEKTLPEVDRIRDLFRENAAGALSGRLGCSEELLVSIDFRGDAHTSIVDLPLLARCGDSLLRVVCWYDNEWGYASAVAELLRRWAVPHAIDGES